MYEMHLSAHRRLGELQTIRSGIIAGLTEWKNRKNSGIIDAEAQALADATILHFTSQIGAVDKYPPCGTIPQLWR